MKICVGVICAVATAGTFGIGWSIYVTPLLEALSRSILPL